VHPVVALGVLCVALAMVMAWGWTRVARALRLPFAAAVLGVALVLTNPFVLSAIGQEVLLVPAVLVLLLVTALEKRPGWFGIVAGLALLTRLDMVVFVGLVGLATPAVRGRWPRALGAAVLVAGPWFLFSWFALGSAIPDTLVIKTAQAPWGVWSYRTGPILYYTREPTAAVLAFLPALGGLFALGGWLLVRAGVRWTPGESLPPLGPVAALGVAGVAYYALFALLDLGPYHWYYVPPVTALTACLAIAIGVWLAQARERPRLRVAAAAAALGVSGALALASVALEVRRGVPWHAPVISTNWGTSRDYARVGRALRGRVGGDAVVGFGEVGSLAFHCRCLIVDQFSDRGRVMPLIDRRIDGSRLAGLLFRANYLRLDRHQAPRAATYALRYTPGPGSGPDVWQIESAWLGVGHLSLVRASR
jgi:hypothetical protein